MRLYQKNKRTEANHPAGEEKQLKDCKGNGIRFVFQKHRSGRSVENDTKGSELREAAAMTQTRAADGVRRAGWTPEHRCGYYAAEARESDDQLGTW